MRRAGRSRLPRALAWGFVACVLLSIAPAHAGTGAVIIAARAQYYPGDDRNVPVAAVPRDHDLLFVNLDAFSFGGHSLTSETPGLFDSGVVEARKSATVGLVGLPPGSYGFFCTVHLEMHGTLVIA